MEAKEIFDKDEMLADLKKAKRAQWVIDAFSYVGDIIEDLLEMVVDQAEQIEELERQMKAHKHLERNGKTVLEL